VLKASDVSTTPFTRHCNDIVQISPSNQFISTSMVARHGVVADMGRLPSYKQTSWPFRVCCHSSWSQNDPCQKRMGAQGEGWTWVFLCCVFL